MTDQEIKDLARENTREIAKLQMMSKEIMKMQQKTDEQIKELKEMQQKTDEQMKDTDERMKKTDEQIKELKEMQQKTDEQMKDTDERMKKTDEQIKELKEMQQKTDEQMKDTDERMKKTDEQIKELKEMQQKTDEQMKDTDERMKKTDEQISKLGKQFGNFGNSRGKEVEDFFYRYFLENKKIMDISFDEVEKNVILSNDSEHDIVLINGQASALISVKYQLKKEDIDYLLEKELKRVQFFWKKLGSHHKIYAGVASYIIEKDMEEYAMQKGLFVFTRSGKTGVMLNEKNFEATVFSM